MEQQGSVAGRDSRDLLAIGGGPAGSTVAPMLAEMGYKAVMLEKARHPRFRIRKVDEAVRYSA
jgi:flavin-dependent dehydrogenase